MIQFYICHAIVVHGNKIVSTRQRKDCNKQDQHLQIIRSVADFQLSITAKLIPSA